MCRWTGRNSNLIALRNQFVKFMNIDHSLSVRGWGNTWFPVMNCLQLILKLFSDKGKKAQFPPNQATTDRAVKFTAPSGLIAETILRDKTRINLHFWEQVLPLYDGRWIKTLLKCHKLFKKLLKKHNLNLLDCFKYNAWHAQV